MHNLSKCPGAALAPSPPSPSPSLARRGLPPSRSRGLRNPPRRRGRGAAPPRLPPPAACPTSPSPAMARPPRTLPCACAASRGGARPWRSPSRRAASSPHPARSPARPSARPRPSALPCPGALAPLRPGSPAPACASTAAHPRCSPVTARSRCGASAMQHVRPRRGPATYSRRVARRVRSSAPACARLVRGASARPCARACWHGARGGLARLVVPSARRVASCRGWRARLPLDVPVYP
jgi:hypothetical protein